MSAQHVSKLYRLYDRPVDRVLAGLGVGRRGRDFWALRDVSFAVEQGRALGIIGPNGSGKSTLLQVVTGIVRPTTGRVQAEGRVAALLELGAGFNPDLTGRENVRLNGEMTGLERDEIEGMLPAVEEFAGLGEFFNRPLREYSSGMQVRLAFSSAIHVRPAVLIVDEALAVGDAQFSSRCVRRMEQMRADGVTLLFVSHDLGLVKRLCDDAMLLLQGEVAARGTPSQVANEYIARVQAPEAAPSRGAEGMQEGSLQHGDGTARVVAVDLLNEAGESTRVLQPGEAARVRVEVCYEQAAVDPYVGLLLRDRRGLDIFGTNTRQERVFPGEVAAGERAVVEFRFAARLTRQEYTLTVAAQHGDGRSQDWLDDVISFRVAESRDLAGVVDLGVAVEWRKAEPVAAR